MSILINNSVINRKGTPSIITDTFANRPLATSLQLGTIFFSSDTNSIYQVEPFGATQAWAVMGGGGGGSQNWDNVLYQGGSFTNHRYANFNNYDLDFQNVGDFNIKFPDNSFWDFNQSFFKYYNSVGVNNILNLNTIDGSILFGDYAGSFGSTHFNVDTPNNRIYFSPSGFPSLLIESGKTTLGDWYPLSNNTLFVCDDNTQTIYANIGGVNNGIKLEADYLSSGFPNFKFGDYEGLYSGGYININNYAIQTFTGSSLYGFEISRGDSWCWFGDREGLISGGHLFIYNEINPYSYLNCYYNYAEWGFKVSFIAETDENPDYYTATIGDWNTSFGGLGASIETYYDASQTYITFYNAGKIQFDNCSIVSGSAGGSSGDHLVIYIGATEYKIALLNP